MKAFHKQNKLFNNLSLLKLLINTDHFDEIIMQNNEKSKTYNLLFSLNLQTESEKYAEEVQILLKSGVHNQ